MDSDTEYEISIRITFPEQILETLKLEKARFVAEYGSRYKSEPHITLYLDRYTQEGFSQLVRDLKEVRTEPFEVQLRAPKARRDEDRHRNLYIVDLSNKEDLRQLHEKVTEVAVRYRSPLLREKTLKRLEQEGIHTDGTRANTSVPEEIFDPHITLGEIDLDSPQADIAQVEENLKDIEGQTILISSISVFFYGKESGAVTSTLLNTVTVPLHS